MTRTLTDPKMQNISTIVTLTNAEKFEKYSNDVRADLDLRAILSSSLPVSTLNETSNNANTVDIAASASFGRK
jgi:hypothetical protein